MRGGVTGCTSGSEPEDLGSTPSPAAMKDTKAAFRWIIALMREKQIPFEVFGGFDAKLFGSKRALADIDFAVSDRNVYKIAKLVKEYIIFGLKRYHDRNWNILLVTLHYKGQEIDICGISTAKIFDSKKKHWVKLDIPISKSVYKAIYGKRIPAVPKRDLMEYKKELNRRIDKADIRALTK